MKMDSIIRNIVILSSLIIFCYQLYTALHNLMSNTSVDSTEKIPISDLEYPPLITICPRQKQSILAEWGNIMGDYGRFVMSGIMNS